MENTDIALLVRLLIAHLLADFPFQPSKWVEEKRKENLQSPYMYYHGAVVFATAYLLLGLWDKPWIALLLTLVHLLIDSAKIYSKKTNGWAFLIDQLSHIGSILICWLILTGKAGPLWLVLLKQGQSAQIWLIVLGYVVNTVVYGIVVGMITQRWRKELERQELEALPEVGKWIGMLERALVFTFVINNALEAVGFILTAKSVFRFGDLKDTQNTRKTEYILVGTLISFTLALLTSLLIKGAMG